MRRINRSTKEDMQKWPSTHNQNPSMEYIAGAIKVRCRSDDVFGQNRCATVTLHLTHVISLRLGAYALGARRTPA